jgi:hypothetical protein
MLKEFHEKSLLNVPYISLCDFMCHVVNNFRKVWDSYDSIVLCNIDTVHQIFRTDFLALSILEHLIYMNICEQWGMQ